SDPEAVRPTPDREYRAGCGEGGDGVGCGHAPDRRLRCVSRTIVAVRLPLRTAVEADLRRRETCAETDRVLRRRGRARTARRAGGGRRVPGEADSDWTPACG